MTFSFGDDLTDDNDYVRFHTTDTITPGFMSDALITSLIAVEGSNNAAVIAGLEYMIGQLSRPDFRADWLQVSNEAARKGLEGVLTKKKLKFGIAAVVATTTHIYRADSDQTEEPTYD